MSTIYYTEEHEWLSVEGDVGTCGITDFAQEQLGDIVYVELPEAGREVVKNDEIAVVESVKAASELYAPVSGEVIESNDALADDPAKVNADAMGGSSSGKVMREASTNSRKVFKAPPTNGSKSVSPAKIPRLISALSPRHRHTRSGRVPMMENRPRTAPPSTDSNRNE